MFVAKDEGGNIRCARCGNYGKITRDHFIPRCSGMNVDEEGNLVGLCERCNREKGNRIVMPDWYVYLTDEQQKKLDRYVRYARSYIRQREMEER